MKRSCDVLNELLQRERLNPNQFAEKIGLKRTQPIYDILSGKIKKISENYADKILDSFPNYRKVWILTGDGSMLNTQRDFLTENQRFEVLLKYLISRGIVRNQSEFAEKVICNNSTITEIKKGITSPQILFMDIEEKFPEVSTLWIKTGYWDMLINDESLEKAIPMLYESKLSNENIAFDTEISVDSINNYRNNLIKPTREDAITLINYFHFRKTDYYGKYGFDVFENDEDVRNIMKERFKYFLHYMYLSPVDFERIVGERIGYIDLISDSYKITIAFPKLNYYWIEHGIGHMLKMAASKDYFNPSIEYYKEKYYKELEKSNELRSKIMSFREKILELTQSSNEERDRLLEELYFFSLIPTNHEVNESLIGKSPFMDMIKMIEKIPKKYWEKYVGELPF